jgi:membrane-bound metal-dependent hydrolase YbcI (DUF457 family)
MPLAVTHVILTIIMIDIFRDYIAKKKFPRWYVLAGGIAGLFPDIDIPIGWVYNFFAGTSLSFHGGITHVLLWPAIIAAASLIYYKIKNQKLGLLLALIAFGWAFHIFLDCVFIGGYLPLWPFYNVCFCPQIFESGGMGLAGMDAILLVLWLVHEEVAHKIKDYI